MAHNSRKHLSFIKRYGFTLIELLISILIFSTLVAVVILVFNPLGQIQKGQDVQRQHDLTEIQVALDAYFNDTGCYPLTVPFGQKWTAGKTVYMQKVPEDVNCTAGEGICYRYQVDSSTSCPQWNILYAELNSTIAQKYPCSLVTTDACAPTNYVTSGVNYCVISGKLDCSYISGNPIPTGSYVYIPPSNSSSQSSSSQQSSSCPQSQRNYACTGGPPARCNIVGTGTGQYCTSNCNGACL